MASFTPKVFPNPIIDKLDVLSFLPWQQLALAFIKAQNLEDHLDKDKVPAQFSSKEDEALDIESQNYKEWRQRDYHPVSWQLSSMDIAFKNRMFGCSITHEIWKRVETYFAYQTKARRE